MNEIIDKINELLSDDDKKKYLKTARKALAKRMSEDEQFIYDYPKIPEVFKDIDSMIKEFANSISEADITIDESTSEGDIKTIFEEWISWILRI